MARKDASMMNRWHLEGIRVTLMAVVAALATAAAPIAPQAQTGALAMSTPSASTPDPDEKNALERGRYAVLIDLDENRLYFKQGDVTLWSAPVGTGTGMRVITHDDDWEFTTPTGRFQVEYKELDPIWIAPDWFFVENNLSVPPRDHPSRFMKGTLGAAAVYISPDLAIHGTDRPELIGQRVSHGCIRLENRYALRLYNSVQVGTEVIIVGGEDVLQEARVVDLREGYDPSLASTGRKPPPPVDRLHARWKTLATDGLLSVLDEQLRADEDESRWDEVAGMLLERARNRDQEALQGLFDRSWRLPSDGVEREWATILAEAYRATGVRALEALSRLRVRERENAAELIVSAMLTLYNGEFDSPSAPWPTRRLPASQVTRRGERGWDALLSAEREHRARVTPSRSAVARIGE
ncbi:MAG TPA: L,D-transpeptidase [Longimicrobiaceae bacterium]|nr:L,D-transpeptidase [Longimicrobiaceae bacterium]